MLVIVLQGFRREGWRACLLFVAGQWSPVYLNEV